MIKINVITKNNNWLRYIRKPNYYLEKKINKLNLKVRKFKKKIFFFTLLLSGSKEIKALNKKFRKTNKSTDVLSFPFQSKTEIEKKLKKEKEIYLGDIIVNFNKVKNKNIIKTFKTDFDRLWIHGFVHLFGHDHKKDKDFEKMKRIEKKYFDYVND